MQFDSASWANAPADTPLEALSRAVRSIPDDIFLDFTGSTFTYAEVDRLSTRMAHAFADLGVTAGQTVLTMLESGIDAVTCWFGVNKLGAIWVPVNTAYRRAFLRHQVTDSGAQILVCEQHYLAALLEIADDLPDVKLILCRGEDALDQLSPVPLARLDDHRGTSDEPLDRQVLPTDIACLIYTSGTTGPSKGCMISHNYLCQTGRQGNEGMPLRPGETMWTCLPMFHISTIGYVIVAAMMARARASIAPNFSVSGFWIEIERSGATMAQLMASIFPLLAQAPDNDAMKRCFGQLRAVSGVPITPELRQIWHERFGVKYLNSYSYGQTEASKLAHHRFGEPTPPEYSAGKVCDDFDIMIVDDDGRPLPPNTPGEIWARPRKPNIMFAGYWRRPAETAHVWHDLWMHTGDIAKVDEQGYLYFIDRKKDYVRSRGENISSFEVERTFMQHPAVSEVAFHSIRRGAGEEEDLKVTLVLREGCTIEHADLCRWAIDNLPHFAVPRFIEYRNSLPKTPTGRIQKFQLRDEGCTSETWDSIEAGIVVVRHKR